MKSANTDADADGQIGWMQETEDCREAYAFAFTSGARNQYITHNKITRAVVCLRNCVPLAIAVAQAVIDNGTTYTYFQVVPSLLLRPRFISSPESPLLGPLGQILRLREGVVAQMKEGLF